MPWYITLSMARTGSYSSKVSRLTVIWGVASCLHPRSPSSTLLNHACFFLFFLFFFFSDWSCWMVTCRSSMRRARTLVGLRCSGRRRRTIRGKLLRSFRLERTARVSCTSRAQQYCSCVLLCKYFTAYCVFVFIVL